MADKKLPATGFPLGGLHVPNPPAHTLLCAHDGPHTAPPATPYRALGIRPTLAYEIDSRPFYVTRDGLGKPIESVFA